MIYILNGVTREVTQTSYPPHKYGGQGYVWCPFCQQRNIDGRIECDGKDDEGNRCGARFENASIDIWTIEERQDAIEPDEFVQTLGKES